MAGACAFDDPSCTTRMRWDRTAGGGNAGLCVPSSGADTGPADTSRPDTLLNDCGGSGTLPGRILDPCGNCLLGRYQCDGTDDLRCEGEPTNEMIITNLGFVSASSTFNSSYPAPLSVDGDLTTSWFSAGPEGGGAPSTYDWEITTNECITGVSIFGNGRHSDRDFRDDFGFGNVTVQILDAADGIQASEMRALPGTPDPEQNIDFEAYGRKVRLLFTGHESTDCGGFSELVVTVVR